MKNISLNIDKVAGFVSKETIAAYEPQVKACMETLENGTGKGNDFLGWAADSVCPDFPRTDYS